MGRRKQKNRENRTYRENLEVFLSCVVELRERPFLIHGINDFRFQVVTDKKSGQITYHSTETDEEHFRSFLLTFRKFILNNEPSNIDWVLNVIRRFAKDEENELCEVIDELKAVWKYTYRKGLIQMQTFGQDITPEYALDLWINGHYFHSDNPEKCKRLKELSAKELSCIRIQLLYSLPLITNLILRIGALVSKALNEDAFAFSEDG